MRPWLILHTVFLILLFSQANAAITDGLIHRYPFQNNASDVVGSYDFTNSGVTFDGDKGLFVDTESDWIYGTDNTWIIRGLTTWTYCTKFYVDDATTDNQAIYTEYTSGSGWMIRLRDQATGDVEIQFDDWVGGEFFSTTTVQDATNYSLCIDYDSTNMRMWVDGVNENNATISLSTAATGSKPAFGSFDAGAYPLDGALWESCFWNRTLMAAEITQYGEQGGCIASGEVPGVSPNLTLTTDFLNDTLITTDTFTFNYSGTVINNSVGHNCNIYEDDVLIGIEEAIDITTTQSVTLNYSNVDGVYREYNITCFNANATDTLIRWAYIDTVNPQISTTLTNNTVFTVNNTLEFTHTFTDNSLYIYNVSVFDSTGNLYKNLNAYAENLTVTTVQNVTSYYANETGNFTLRLNVKDGHTQKTIPNIPWDRYTQDVSSVGVDIPGVITMTTPQKQCVEDFYLSKETDRYKFIFEIKRGCLNSDINVYLDSDLPFNYVGDRWGYDGHFILNDYYWLDWMTEDAVLTDISYNKGLGLWRVQFRPLNNLVIFNSIGIINSVTKDYSFEVIDADFLINSTYIIPSSLTTFDTLYGYCQATAESAVNVTYDYTLYKNGVDVISNNFTVGSGTVDGYQAYGGLNLPFDPSFAYDGNISSYADFYTGQRYAVYNISKPLTTRDVTFMSIDAYMINYGTIPFASGLRFYCLDEEDDYTSIGFLDGSLVSIVEDDYTTTPLVLNISNADCLSMNQRYVYLYVDNGASPTYNSELLELNNTQWTYNYTTYPVGDTVEVLSYSDLTSADDFVLECRAYDGSIFTSALNSTTYTVETLSINNVTYSGNITARVRNLSYSIGYQCYSGSTTTINLYIDGGYEDTLTGLTCNNASKTYNGVYTHDNEGSFDISFYFNTSVDPSVSNDWYGNATFTSDLNNPSVAINYTTLGGFSANEVNITLTCTDSITGTLEYNTTFNSVIILQEDNANNTAVTNTTSGIAGNNAIIGACGDGFGVTTDELNFTGYVKELILIDERTGDAFDVLNISNAVLYWDDNSTSYSFTDNNTTGINFTSFMNDKLRLELTYSSGTVITRYIDVSLIDDETRMCANVEGVTHYAQLVTSAQLKPVVVKSLFADCYIVADYTRFAYQTGKSLQFYTIDTQYEFLTQDDEGVLYQLASIDGSLNEPINIDVLELQNEGYNFGIRREGLAVKKTGDYTFTIKYSNTGNDNEEASILVTRQDTGATIYEDTELSTPNAFTINLDVTGESNLNTSTLFKVKVMTVDDQDTTRTITRYFNLSGAVGVLNAAFVAIMVIFLIIFGMSFTVSQTAFSWFGLMILLTCLALTFMAVSVWYITFLQVVCMILLLYTGIAMFSRNTVTVA